MFLLHSVAYSCPVFQAPHIEERVFSPLYILASFMWADYRSLEYFWTYYPFPWFIFFFLCHSHTLDDSSFVVQSEVREPNSSSSVFLSQDGLVYWRSFVFSGKFKNFLIWLCKKYSWWFDRNCTESVECLGEYTLLKNIDSSNQTQYIFLIC